jgi:hypothetical protein
MLGIESPYCCVNAVHQMRRSGDFALRVFCHRCLHPVPSSIEKHTRLENLQCFSLLAFLAQREERIARNAAVLEQLKVKDMADELARSIRPKRVLEAAPSKSRCRV